MATFVEEVGIDIEFGVEVESFQIQHFLQRGTRRSEPALGCTGVMCLRRCASASASPLGHQVSLLMKIWSANPT